MQARIAAHDAKALKGLSVLPDGGIITGSVDQTIKIWTPGASGGYDQGTQLDLVGEVNHIEIMDPFVIWSMDVILPDIPEEPVGQVHIMSMSDNSTYQLQRSEAMPYAHSQSVYQFSARVVGAEVLIVTGGLEGMIHMWTFNGSAVSHVGSMEGHIRGITSLVLIGRSKRYHHSFTCIS
jgi:WD40 repeat protein